MHTGRTAVRSSDDGSLGFHTNQKKKAASYFPSIRHVRQTLQGDERAKHVCYLEDSRNLQTPFAHLIVAGPRLAPLVQLPAPPDAPAS